MSIKVIAVLSAVLTLAFYSQLAIAAADPYQ
jgi:hypothetical protein